MKNFKKIICAGAIAFASVSYSNAFETVALGAFDGNTVSIGNQSGSFIIVAPDCTDQIVYSNYGNFVFTIFCNGSPAPRILIAYNSASQSCTTINIIDPNYAVPDCGVNLWRVTRSN